MTATTQNNYEICDKIKNLLNKSVIQFCMFIFNNAFANTFTNASFGNTCVRILSQSILYHKTKTSELHIQWDKKICMSCVHPNALEMKAYLKDFPSCICFCQALLFLFLKLNNTLLSGHTTSKNFLKYSSTWLNLFLFKNWCHWIFCVLIYSLCIECKTLPVKNTVHEVHISVKGATIVILYIKQTYAISSSSSSHISHSDWCIELMIKHSNQKIWHLPNRVH